MDLSSLKFVLNNHNNDSSFQIVDDQSDFIIINKNNGIAVQVTDNENEKKDLETHLKEIYGENIFVLNRIDQPVSGLIIFGKSREFTKAFTELLKERLVKKTYLALVSGHPNSEPTELIHFIKKLHNRAQTADEPIDESFKEAILKYTKIQSFDNYHLLQIELKTGRFHQIRAQLATVELPIKGDIKYGSRRPNLNRSIGLHSHKLSFVHPITKEAFKYEAPLPNNDILWSLVDTSLLYP